MYRVAAGSFFTSRGSGLTNNTVHGNYRESGRQMMAAYDQLPAAVREVLRNAIVDWACRPILKEARELSPQRLCDELVKADAGTVRAMARKDWKKQCAAYVEAQRPRRRRDWLDRPAGVKF